MEQNYLEVETPVRIPAPIPEAHIDAVPSGDWYLHTSPEVCMKRLLAAGMPRLFQICRCFRQGERGQRHLPEFTLLEWYTAEVDYSHMMAQCEELIRAVARWNGFGERIVYQGETVDLSGIWDRLTVREAFERYASLSVEDALVRGKFDEVIAFEIEPHLGREKPLFLHDYPAECGALARLKPEDPSVAERFELYIRGMELCNAFTELTDAAEQRTRFQEEQTIRQKNGKPVYPLPEPFLDALADMPPASGNALGVDRLVMLFADAAEIDEVVTFTTEAL